MNLQNVSKNNPELAINVREVFAAPPGWAFVEHDYKALELRIMAYIANDEKLVERFEGGADLHRLHSELLFGEYNEQLRTLAKNFFYAWRGGGGAQAIQMALAKRGIFLQQAFLEECLRKMQLEYPRVVAWQVARGAELARQAAEQRPQLFHNAFGVPRVFLGYAPIKDVLANEIQGTAAYLLNFCLLRLRQQPEVWRYLLLQVHDSLLSLAPLGQVEWVAAAIKAEMERPTWLCGRFVSFPVEVKVGSRWGALAPLSEELEA